MKYQGNIDQAARWDHTRVFGVLATLPCSPFALQHHQVGWEMLGKVAKQCLNNHAIGVHVRVRPFVVRKKQHMRSCLVLTKIYFIFWEISSERMDVKREWNKQFWKTFDCCRSSSRTSCMENVLRRWLSENIKSKSCLEFLLAHLHRLCSGMSEPFVSSTLSKAQTYLNYVA